MPGSAAISASRTPLANRKVAGVLIPSRPYNFLAVGRIVGTEPNSKVPLAVTEEDWVVPPQDSLWLAHATWEEAADASATLQRAAGLRSPRSATASGAASTPRYR